MKKTYTELGESSKYTYPTSLVGHTVRMAVSDTLSTMNSLSGFNALLKRVLFGSNIQQIEESCFLGCSNLKSIKLTENILSIENESFKNCTRLTSIDNSLSFTEYIGSNAFDNCGFTTLTINTSEAAKTPAGYGTLIFANNAQLLTTTMNDVFFTNKMFENCTNLNTITIDDNAQIVYSDEEPFSNCPNLTSITFPANVMDIYDDINALTLKNSSIVSVYANGMTSEEVDKVVGKTIINAGYYSEPVSTDDIKLGTIYEFNNDESGSAQEDANNFFLNAIRNHIPVIYIHCNDKCSYCRSFKKNILHNDTFIKWFKDLKCVIAYFNGWISYDAKTRVNCEPNFTSIIYNNKTYLFKKQTTNLQGTILNTSINYDLTYSNKIFLPSKEQYCMFWSYPVFTSDGCYPTINYFWKRSNDDLIVPIAYKFTDSQINNFILNENFTIIGNKFIVKFNAITLDEFNKSKCGLKYTINGSTTYYEIDATYNGKFSIGHKQIYLYFEKYSIYLYLPQRYAMTEEAGNIIYDTSSISTFQTMITDLCKNVFKCTDLNYKQNDSEITIIPSVVSCWGVEHDCDVYDKDGGCHHFTYAP